MVTVFSNSLTGKEEVKVLKKKEANTMFIHLPYYKTFPVHNLFMQLPIQNLNLFA
jgi:hypothetical protein